MVYNTLPPDKGDLFPLCFMDKERHGYHRLLFSDVAIHVGCINRSKVSSSKDDSILWNYKKNTILKLRFNIVPFAIRESQYKNKIP